MNDPDLRKHLVELLDGGQAHITFDDALKGFPVDRAGERPGGSPHSAWELLEHIRIALEDIVRFSGALEEGPRAEGDPSMPKGYEALKWPEGYWPGSPGPKDAEEWTRSAGAIREDLAAFVKLIEDPAQDLVKAFPWGDGQTLLREALLIADHNSYHLGQLMLVRRMLE